MFSQKYERKREILQIQICLCKEKMFRENTIKSVIKKEEKARAIKENMFTTLWCFSVGCIRTTINCSRVKNLRYYDVSSAKWCKVTVSERVEESSLKNTIRKPSLCANYTFIVAIIIFRALLKPRCTRGFSFESLFLRLPKLNVEAENESAYLGSICASCTSMNGRSYIPTQNW